MMIRRSLTSITRALSRLGPALQLMTAVRSSAGAPARKKPVLSPARRRALAWQGQYMSYVRELPPRQKAKVKALRARKGVEAAIRFAKRLTKR